MTDLAAARAEVAARRRSLEEAVVADASAAVAARLVELLAAHHPPGRVGAYFAADGEVDPSPALERLGGAGWSAWYPALHPTGPPSGMTFRRWDGPDRPPPGRFGIPTPPPTAATCAPPDLSVVLVPLVLFGPGGARAGRGAGYYDRTFAWLRDVDRPAKPVLVGLGHDFQEARDLVPNPWDVALDVVVTPTRTIEA